MMSKPTPHNPELERLLAENKVKVDAMTPEQKLRMHEAQRESWVRGEMELIKASREDQKAGRPFRNE